MSASDVEIQYISRDGIYDLFVNGRFRDFYMTFAEAALAAEEIIHRPVDVVQQWKEMLKKKGKVRR